MLLGVAHDLRGGVEAHRLAVQQRGREYRGMVALHPGRGVGQVREAGGMALRKAVRAEALDLLEHALGEVGVVAAADHAADQLVSVHRHSLRIFEGGHGAAQLVGFAGGEAGGDDGHPHGLLLKEWHAQGAAEHLLQLVLRTVFLAGGGVDRRLVAPAPAQVGMYHVALNRPGPDEGHLHHQVVELRWPQTRQDVHLRAAFDLEHAQRVGPAQHGVGLGTVAGHVGEIEVGNAVPAQEVEAAPQAAQHPQRQDIHLQQAERLDVILVPLQHRAPVHGGVADHRHLDQRPARHDKAADMGGEVAGEVLDLLGQLQRKAEAAVGQVEALGRGDFGQAVVPPWAPAGLGQPPGDVLRQPERLADLAHRRSAAKADHRADDGGAVAAVAAVDELDHLLAALVLEVDVDVGRLSPLHRKEAFKQEVVLGGIHRGDAEHVADGGVSGGAASLTEDVLVSGKAHDLVHRQEVGRVVQPLD